MERFENTPSPVPPQKPKRPYRILNALLDSLLVMGFMVLLSVAVTLLAYSSDRFFVQRAEITGLLNLASFALVIFIRHKKWNVRIKTLFAIPKQIKTVIPLLIFSAAGLTVVLSEIDNMLRPVLGDSLLYEILENLFTQNLPAVFFAVGIIAPLSEEFFFRGYLYTRLRESVSPITAVIATAILFGIFHLNPSQMISGFFTGCILGYLMASTGSLIYPMLFHFFFNTIPLICIALGLTIQGYTESGPSVHQPLWLTASGFIIMAASVVLLLQLLPKPEHELHNTKEAEETKKEEDTESQTILKESSKEDQNIDGDKNA